MLAKTGSVGLPRGDTYWQHDRKEVAHGIGQQHNQTYHTGGR